MYTVAHKYTVAHANIRTFIEAFCVMYTSSLKNLRSVIMFCSTLENVMGELHRNNPFDLVSCRIEGAANMLRIFFKNETDLKSVI